MALRKVLCLAVGLSLVAPCAAQNGGDPNKKDGESQSACTLNVAWNRAFGSWASQFQSFVERELPTLSKNYSEADLPFRWNVVFTARAQDVATLLDAAAAAVSKIHLPQDLSGTKLDLESGLRELMIADKEIATLTTLLARLRQTRSELTNSELVCSSRAVFDHSRLSVVGEEVLAGFTKPESIFEYNYSSGCPWEVEVGKLLFAIFSFNQQEKQAEQFEKAFKSAPRFVFSGQPLFEMSKQVCEEQRVRSRGIYDALSKELDSSIEFVSALDLAWRDYRTKLARIVLPIAEEQLLEGSEVLQELTTLTRQMTSASISQRVALRANLLAVLLDALDDITTGKCNKLSSLIAIERVKDLVSVTDFEISLLRDNGYPIAEIRDLDRLRMQLTSASSRLAKSASAAKKHCRE